MGKTFHGHSGFIANKVKCLRLAVCRKQMGIEPRTFENATQCSVNFRYS